MKMKVISVITPSYNQGKYISQTIKSILTQVGNFYIDYIIMDGKSKDNSIEVIKRYEKLLINNCQKEKKDGLTFYKKKTKEFIFNNCLGISYRWFSEKDNGQADAINKGFNIARGSIYGWLNSDDEYYPDVFQKVIKVNWYKYDFSYGKGMWINDKGDDITLYPTFYPNKYSMSFLRCTLCQPTIFFKKDSFYNLGELNNNYFCSFDFEYWLRAIFNKKRFHYIPSMIAKSRMYLKNKSVSNQQTTVLDEAKDIKDLYFKDRKLNFFILYFFKKIINFFTDRQEKMLFNRIKGE